MRERTLQKDVAATSRKGSYMREPDSFRSPVWGRGKGRSRDDGDPVPGLISLSGGREVCHVVAGLTMVKLGTRKLI